MERYIVDLIAVLPMSDDYNTIAVVMDRLSKMAHYIPCTTELNTEAFTKLFVQNIFRLHGLPTKIISDRDLLFTSKFRKWVMTKLEIKRNLSTAYHPQTARQTEQVNTILEQYLQCYCNYNQDNWVRLLPVV